VVHLLNGKIGRITTAGAVSSLRLRSTGTGLSSITAGPDGALWFADPQANSIGRVPAGPLPPADSVSGAFTTGPQCGLRCAPPTYDLDVSGGPQGEAPKGEITFTKGTLFVDAQFAQGTFSCLRASGNRATLGVDFAGSSTTPARSALVFLEDNVPTGDRFAVVDLPAGTAPSSCPAAPPAGVTLAPVVNGDVLVRDESAPTCGGRAATLVGDAGDDTLRGTAGDDVIVGGGGDDVILGEGGNDVVCAGPGGDRVWGGPGNDALLGEDGADLLRGGSGNDLLVGGAGVDRLRGAPGDDTLLGGPGDDLLLGGLGRDNCPPEGADVRIGCEQ
jgi:Ca2+-binding RTX toxin-like protein